MCDGEKKGGHFLTGLALGALAGAGLFYFLTSTKEGKRVKAQLEEKGDDVLAELQDLITNLEEKSEEFKEKADRAIALSQIEKLRARGRSAVNSFIRNGKPLT